MIGLWWCLAIMIPVLLIDNIFLFKFERQIESLLKQPAVEPYKEPEPICGCGHHLAFHKQGEGCKKTEVQIYYGGKRVVLPPKPIAKNQQPKFVGRQPDFTAILDALELNVELERWNTKVAAIRNNAVSVEIPCPCAGYIGPEYLPQVVA